MGRSEDFPIDFTVEIGKVPPAKFMAENRSEVKREGEKERESGKSKTGLKLYHGEPLKLICRSSGRLYIP